MAEYRNGIGSREIRRNPWLDWSLRPCYLALKSVHPCHPYSRLDSMCSDDLGQALNVLPRKNFGKRTKPYEIGLNDDPIGYSRRRNECV